MFATGFQSFAFQTCGNSVAPITGGGFIYTTASYKHKQDEYQKTLAAKYSDLQNVNNEIAHADQLRQQQLVLIAQRRVAKNAAKQLAATEAQLQESINVLRIERARLMMAIDDEECALVLLLSMPFVH